ncbi:MAG: Gfo/Idh/MocA family oxidoreductase [Thalassobaculaceae bacterium]|nr:Gfo/Idh/MocA family oxidoreductase [Thalassobaculaceae bacterium]
MTDRVAIVGCGYFAAFHHEAWARMPGVEVVAICDRDIARARAARDLHHPGAAVFDSVERLLDEAGPSLVDIVTPPPTHAPLTALCAARGVDVICQKPLAPDLDEARRLVDDAEDAGIRLAVHENFRFQPWFREARRLIDGGTLGRLHSVAFRMRPGDGQGPRAYLDRQPYFQQMPRFLVHETAVHLIDTFRMLMGEVTSLYADLRRINPVIAGEDAGYILMGFEGGSTGMVDGNRLNDHVAENTRLTMGEMWLEGEGGVLRLDGSGRLYWKPHGGADAEHAYAWENRGFGGDCVFATNAHIIAAWRAGDTAQNEGRAYLRNMALVEAAYRSSEQGRRLDVEAC